MELISREEAMEAIRAIKEVMLTNGEVINALYHVPTIESRQKGKWIDCSEEGYVECPFCHYLTNCDDNIEELHFCWNCGAELGADMRGRE